PWYTDSFDQGIDYYFNEQFGDYPVQQVTWTMANAYCAFRGRRLPTDAEWQRVAQGSRVHGTYRVYPAEGIVTLEDCQDPNAYIAANACDGKIEFSRVAEPGGDYVDEGYVNVGEGDQLTLAPGQVYHLFSNVAEFTSDFFQEDVTCKSELPEGDFPWDLDPNADPSDPGGVVKDIADCIPCDDCSSYTGEFKDLCDQECKVCEACTGSRPDGLGGSDTYRPEGYPLSPVDCHIDCWGETRESPRCMRWSHFEQPVDPEVLAGIGTEKIVRGGHVGISSPNIDECRFRADYRQKRMRPDGSPDTANFGTAKGVGFRCARTLTANERDKLFDEGTNHGPFEHLAGGAAEPLEVIDPIFSVAVDTPPDAGSTPTPDATGDPDVIPTPDAETSPDVSAPGPDPDVVDTPPATPDVSHGGVDDAASDQDAEAASADPPPADAESLPDASEVPETIDEPSDPP
ncbi:MAG: SUMF1/EgtB/PvdO family nonheme iron enzyme, partial [Myxococcota bacterium]|nr:SUMF1/EgtB/PvdO family nonheme iron enzyme [Myxococcota bacterium]